MSGKEFSVSFRPLLLKVKNTLVPSAVRLACGRLLCDAPGGEGLVGERGRETVVMSPGAKVLTNGQTNNLEPAGVTNNINITMPGMQVRSERDVHVLAGLVAERLAYQMAG